jgi:hypothetical protein
MVQPAAIERAITKVNDQATFISELLDQALGWPVSEGIEELDELSYGWTPDELRARGLAEQLVDGQVWQVRPFVSSQPWGIFLLEFKRPDVFVTGRGMTTPLRQVLRGLAPSRRKSSNLASWRSENLLFICTHAYKYFRFAHFRTTEGESDRSRLATFGWDPDSPVRTVCEFNLPALAWPRAQSSSLWIASWTAAFDVERVTKRFYEDYARVFGMVERAIARTTKIDKMELRQFTQVLVNRLMFLRFVERKRWLSFRGRNDYLRALCSAGGIQRRSLYRSRLVPLFFQALSGQGKSSAEVSGQVPFLNGGLFEETDLDRRVADVPDDALTPIIGDEGLFYRYNFTIEESTPLDIEVAVDPEMLGKVFEELVAERHESGAYYTPRPVVSFMCREALKGYLVTRTNVPEKAIAKLVDSHQIGEGLTDLHAKHVVEALASLKAVDPACGSGAYLLGLLHELVGVYRTLQSDLLLADPQFLYELKLRIISSSLYGVDIDAFASEIAKLRLWLSLAVEADRPVPLPNLDLKIETGDSLLGADPSSVADLFGDVLHKRAEKLATLMVSYLSAHDSSKIALRAAIEKEQKAIAKELHSSLRPGIVDWRVQFAEVFGPNRGFDIVLANPPYVRKEGIDAASKAILLQNFGDAITGRSDLYCSFYARSAQLLREGGMHVFVCSSSWLDADYGVKLQGYLLRTCRVRTIVDSAVEKQFSTANINTIISVLQRGKADQGSETQFVTLNGPFSQALADPGLRRTITVKQQALLSAAGSSSGKWGGKYLRAPDVYRRIFGSLASRFVPLSVLAEVSGYIHDNNTGDSYPRKSVLWSVRDTQSIQVGPNSPGVKKIGVNPHGNSLDFAPVLFPRTFGTRHVIPWCGGGVLGKEFYKVVPRPNASVVSLIAQLNSTFGILQREILGIKGLGGGALKFAAVDVMQFLVTPDLDETKVRPSLERLVARPIEDISIELVQPDRRALDAVIIEHLGLPDSILEELYQSVQSLVEGRRDKASRVI